MVHFGNGYIISNSHCAVCLVRILGPTFSEDVLMEQQTDLRERYDLPPQEVITDPEVLLTPPSLRGVSGENNSAT